MNSFLLACLKNYKEVAKILLDNGVNKEHTNIFGYTGFLLAC